MYELTAGDGEVYVLPSRPSIPDPEPTNNDPVKLSIDGLASDAVYTLRLWTRSLSGLLSDNSTTFTWQVLAAAPSVAVLLRPDSNSGSSRPRFQFAANIGGGSFVNDTKSPNGRSSSGLSSIVANATFEMLLLLDPDLGTFHSPPVCDASRADSSSQRDCVEAGCSATGCNYSVQLSQARGTLQAYTLQVRARLFSSTGPETTLLWSYDRCSASEFAVFSGVDTVTCEPCPAGGDCSGSALTADPTLPSSEVVVKQEAVAAQPGFWASNTANDLNFYECPVPSACLPGVNGSRSVCATGYSGVLCTVCSPGYFNQYGLCAQCR